MIGRASPDTLRQFYIRVAAPREARRAKRGGGGRTRTYEGIASGFTVRPLCRSGHSPGSRRTALISKDNRVRPPAGRVVPVLCGARSVKSMDGAAPPFAKAADAWE